MSHVRIYDGNIRYENIGCGTAGIAAFDKLAAGSKAIRCGGGRLRKIEYIRFGGILG